MPKFLDLSCYIELTGSNKRLKEYDHDFGDPPRDRYIEMVVPVPDTASTFSIHLQSHKYISPGLSMFVWIDGQYQCNRYKLNLPLPVGNTVSRKSLVDFRVRQKEIRHKDAFIGRDWSFSKLNIGGPGQPTNVNDATLKECGTINVIVLRCRAAEPPPRPTPSAAVNKVQRNGKKAQPSKEKKAKTPETSDDEGVGDIWGMGLFDGTTDVPESLDFSDFSDFSDSDSSTQSSADAALMLDGHGSPRRSHRHKHHHRHRHGPSYSPSSDGYDSEESQMARRDYKVRRSGHAQGNGPSNPLGGLSEAFARHGIGAQYGQPQNVQGQKHNRYPSPAQLEQAQNMGTSAWHNFMQPNQGNHSRPAGMEQYGRPNVVIGGFDNPGGNSYANGPWNQNQDQNQNPQRDNEGWEIPPEFRPGSQGIGGNSRQSHSRPSHNGGWRNPNGNPNSIRQNNAPPQNFSWKSGHGGGGCWDSHAQHQNNFWPDPNQQPGNNPGGQGNQNWNNGPNQANGNGGQNGNGGWVQPNQQNNNGGNWGNGNSNAGGNWYGNNPNHNSGGGGWAQPTNAHKNSGGGGWGNPNPNGPSSNAGGGGAWGNPSKPPSNAGGGSGWGNPNDANNDPGGGSTWGNPDNGNNNQPDGGGAWGGNDNNQNSGGDWNGNSNEQQNNNSWGGGANQNGGDAWGNSNENQQNSGNNWDGNDNNNQSGGGNDWNAGGNTNDQNNNNNDWNANTNNKNNQNDGSGWGNPEDQKNSNNNDNNWGGSNNQNNNNNDNWGNQDSNNYQSGWGDPNQNDDDRKSRKSHRSQKSHHSKHSHRTYPNATDSKAKDEDDEPYFVPWSQSAFHPASTKSHERSQPRGRRANEMYLAPEEPIYTLPEDCHLVKEENVQHQVRCGPAAEYVHSTGRPIYLDSINEPYARFRFDYRSKDELKKRLDLDDDAFKEDAQDAKDRFAGMSKEELIAELLKEKGMHDKGSDGGSDSSRSVRALKAGNGWKTPGSNGGGGGGGDGWNNTGGNGNDQWNNAAW